LASTITYQDNKAIKEVGSLETKSILNCEINQCHGFQLKLPGSMKIHPMFHVSLLEPYHTFTNPGRIHDPLHLSKFMVNKSMEWKTFWIHMSLIVNSNILFISMSMMRANAPRYQWRTYQMLWKRCMNFIDDIQTNPSLFLVDLIVRKGVMSWMPMPSHGVHSFECFHP